MKVGIQNKEGRLILVWNDGKRRTMAIGLADSNSARAIAKKKAAQIELDFQLGEGHYDQKKCDMFSRIFTKSIKLLNI